MSDDNCGNQTYSFNGEFENDETQVVEDIKYVTFEWFPYPYEGTSKCMSRVHLIYMLKTKYY